MRITTAYPWEGFPPDTTLDIDDVLARRLVHDGRARVAADDAALGEPPNPEIPPDETPREVPVAYWTNAQLDAYAAAYATEHDAPLFDGPMNRKQKAAVVEAAIEATRETEHASTAGDGGNNQGDAHVG